jgi:hypothetical protein
MKKCNPITAHIRSMPPRPISGARGPLAGAKRIRRFAKSKAIGKNTRRRQSLAPVIRNAHPSAGDSPAKNIAATGTRIILLRESDPNSTPDKPTFDNARHRLATSINATLA